MRIAKTFLQRLLILALGLLSVWLIVFVLFDFAVSEIAMVTGIEPHIRDRCDRFEICTSLTTYWTTLIRGFHRQL